MALSIKLYKGGAETVMVTNVKTLETFIIRMGECSNRTMQLVIDGRKDQFTFKTLPPEKHKPRN